MLKILGAVILFVAPLVVMEILQDRNQLNTPTLPDDDGHLDAPPTLVGAKWNDTQFLQKLGIAPL